MSYQFQIHFSRWDSKRGRRVRSTPLFLHADDIGGAFRIAEAVLTGLRNDPTGEYSIESVSQVGSGGVDADPMGVGMFAVKEEADA